jgi:hypothetical protein
MDTQSSEWDEAFWRVQVRLPRAVLLPLYKQAKETGASYSEVFATYIRDELAKWRAYAGHSGPEHS